MLGKTFFSFLRQYPLDEAVEYFAEIDGQMVYLKRKSALKGSRTPNLLIRSQMLYPIEL